MRIFVTGGTGFIGTHFLRVALAAGHEVHALRRPGSRLRVALHCEPKWIEAELATVPAAALKECDVLVHLAAAGVNGAATWQECFATNVEQSLRLWLAASDAGISRFVICGSCFEYGRAGERYKFIPTDAPLEPTGPYHASKAAASMAALGIAVERKVSLSLLRPFHVFGEGESEARFWPSLRAAARADRDFPMTKGEQIRDFIEVGEVAKKFLTELSEPALAGEPKIRHIGSGHPQSLRGFAEYWWKQWKSPGELKIGMVPYRANEVMRLVPRLKPLSRSSLGTKANQK